MSSPLPDATTLAADRTRLAYERTLMAWIRTAVSLISFGFAIYKFSQFLREGRLSAPPEPGSPVLASVMIVTGLVALCLAWLQHHQQMKVLRQQFGPMPYSLAGVIAAFTAALGTLALIEVAFRL